MNRLVATLAKAVPIVRDAGIPFTVIGGPVHATYTGRRWRQDDDDVDFGLTRGDAERALEALAARGFRPERPDDKDWLYKAYDGDTLLDLIFVVGDTLHIDEEMVARATETEVAGVSVPLMDPTDYVVSQALSNKREAPEYWHNGLDVCAATAIDWERAMRLAGEREERILAMWHYARSCGVDAPPPPR